MPASMAAPMSLVWIWQFHRPSPPTTTMESPMPPQACLKAAMSSSGVSKKYITSYRCSPASTAPAPAWPAAAAPAWPVAAPSAAPPTGTPSTPTTPGSSSGGSGSSRPSTTHSTASQSSTKPAPPASTTPASAKTSSSSGVLSKLSWPAVLHRSAMSIKSEPSASQTLACSAMSLSTVRIVPSFGSSTASYADCLAAISPAASD